MGDSPTIASKKASIDDEILPAASRRATLIDETIQAPASNNRNPKARTPPRLSPPALKRQRTEPAKRTSSPLAHGANLNRSFPTFAHHTDTSDKYVRASCNPGTRIDSPKWNRKSLFIVCNSRISIKASKAERDGYILSPESCLRWIDQPSR